MSCTIKSRWWHWLFGVALPLFTVGFELTTHQMSGTMFDPMTTPWHAVLMAALPAGIAVRLLSKESDTIAKTALVMIGLGLPYASLLAVVIGPSHLTALFKFGFGLICLFAHPREGIVTLFGDYYLSPIAATAYFGPIMGWAIGVWLAFGNLFKKHSRNVFSSSLLISLGIGCVIVGFLEVRSKHLQSAIASALAEAHGKNIVTNRELLQSPHAKDTIARLSHMGQQFSSAGALYAVGPVDVFGPWTALSMGLPHPVDVVRRFPAGDASKLHQLLWPGEPVTPRSWRGLSEWERY